MKQINASSLGSTSVELPRPQPKLLLVVCQKRQGVQSSKEGGERGVWHSYLLIKHSTKLTCHTFYAIIHRTCILHPFYCWSLADLLSFLLPLPYYGNSHNSQDRQSVKETRKGKMSSRRSFDLLRLMTGACRLACWEKRPPFWNILILFLRLQLPKLFWNMEWIKFASSKSSPFKYLIPRYSIPIFVSHHCIESEWDLISHYYNHYSHCRWLTLLLTLPSLLLNSRLRHTFPACPLRN